jgi:hypothetical protein
MLKEKNPDLIFLLLNFIETKFFVFTGPNLTTSIYNDSVVNFYIQRHARPSTFWKIFLNSP